ncbi:DUF2334 domain-containing protein [Sporosarcina aquimarina]|uniref:DUF2334 domain-containing protein n=1 Tax=Sporosarcina aquimarina TaxID=114975 RepID=A0ABU4FYS4_9BACL|nr:DUF2334 domain-containing protein [Sporosarcina aquimarina]MDW0109811.1 DUF2334 domain-containing protein [Sporosarcina aquimarina]
MYFKIAALISLMIFSGWIFSWDTASATNEKPTILFIYTSERDQVDENVHMLDATFSAFAAKQHVVSAESFKSELMQGTDMVVFVGDYEMALPSHLINAIDRYEGEIIVIGYNVNQFKTFSEWQFQEEVEIGSLGNTSLFVAMSLIDVIPPKGSEVIEVGKRFDAQHPYIVKNGRLTYIASSAFESDQKYALSKRMHKIMGVEEPTVHPAYIRLEDISPVSDYKLVQETGDYLADRGIPFYLAVIPVYVNNENGEKIYMKSNRKLVKVLRNLQNRGGIIIGHGYTHSYRYEETGEGFEFWDDQLNQKITTERTDTLPEPLPTRESFRSINDYNRFMDKIDVIEKGYIETKHRKAIEELTDIELYPLAFEAPHYTMSSTGYKITSNYFNSVFGQVQLSDEDWEIMDAPLFVSSPAILSGMTLYPETIGYANPQLEDPLQVAKDSVKRLKDIPGSMVGGFYHPYLGLEHLQEMLDLMYSVGTIEWLDLREEDQLVQTDQVKIHQQANGVLTVKSARTTWKRLVENSVEKPFEAVLWGLSVVVLLFIIAFFIYIVNLRAALKKRLFRERDFSG